LRAYGRDLGAIRVFHPRSRAAMADKSPRQHLSKKTGKSLKEKRAEKHTKQAAKESQTRLVPPRKR
jgi:hypothetical protein